MSSAEKHVVLVGSGISSLTTAYTLLKTQNSNFHISIIDKARLPGGRLTSRTYPNTTTLEPGARVFQSNSPAFHNELDVWSQEGWISEVDHSRLRGVKGKDTGERWWEAGQGGWTGSLTPGLVEQIKAAGGKRVSWHFNTTVKPSQTARDFQTDPSIDIPAPDIIVHTAPSPQTSVLLPQIQATKPTDYLQSFALLYPTLQIPYKYPIYQRDPHPKISVIATGTRPDMTEASGLIIHATPQQLSLTYDRESTTDQDIQKAFVKLLTGTSLLPQDLLEGMKSVAETDRQVKRWKFAQVARPPGEQAEGEIRVMESNSGVVIIAGDGESERGGVEGAWYSGKAVAEWISKRLA